ncbi:MAG: hypothetical protein GXO26_05135 [Crenarchaeota archaeon]|nr:hypothetical protein [Thermoproteota archaeon]
MYYRDIPILFNIKRVLEYAYIDDLYRDSVLYTAKYIIKNRDIPKDTSFADISLAILLLSQIHPITVHYVFQKYGNILERLLPYLPTSYIYELCSDWLPAILVERLIVEKISPRLVVFYDIAVPIANFLRNVKHRVYPKKLVEHYVARGFVFMTFRDYVWATLDSIITWLEEKSRKLRPYLPQTLLEELEREAKYITYYTHLQYQDYGRNSRSIHPPCIQTLLKALEDGEDLPHYARFVVASYMLHYLVKYEKKNIEEAVKTVVQLFKNVPDFDEKKTRYQVQHIAGLVGGRKFYLPPNCNELRSLGLCPVDGKCEVKNPLAYVLKMLKGPWRR